MEWLLEVVYGELDESLKKEAELLGKILKKAPTDFKVSVILEFREELQKEGKLLTNPLEMVAWTLVNEELKHVSDFKEVSYVEGTWRVVGSEELKEYLEKHPDAEEWEVFLINLASALSEAKDLDDLEKILKEKGIID